MCFLCEAPDMPHVYVLSSLRLQSPTLCSLFPFDFSTVGFYIPKDVLQHVKEQGQLLFFLNQQTLCPGENQSFSEYRKKLAKTKFDPQTKIPLPSRTLLA